MTSLSSRSHYSLLVFLLLLFILYLHRVDPKYHLPMYFAGERVDMVLKIDENQERSEPYEIRVDPSNDCDNVKSSSAVINVLPAKSNQYSTTTSQPSIKMV